MLHSMKLEFVYEFCTGILVLIKIYKVGIVGEVELLGSL